MDNMKPRDNCLDVLKAIMAIFIIFTHSSFSDTHRSWLLFPLIIDMAVPVFMIISGYVNSISNENLSLREQITPQRLGRKIKRILLPFLPFAMFDIVYWVAIEKVGVKWSIINIVFQQWGDGGYYPIVMLEMILAFPLIHSLSQHRGGTVLIVVINIASEILFNLGAKFGGVAGQVIVWVHRISLTRYLVFILAGIFLYKYRDRIKISNTLLYGMIGIITILVRYYFIPTPIIFSLWRSTAFYVVMWPLSWVMLFIYWNKKIKNKLLGLFGKASYHTFLVQMLYYFLIKIGLFPEPGFIVNIIICLFAGQSYYQINTLGINRIEEYKNV